LASIAILQESSGALRLSFEIVRKMYEAFLIMNSMSGGTFAYPVIKEREIKLNGTS
jgi:hypothetical protein